MPYNCVNFIFWDNVGYWEVYNFYIFLDNSSFLLCNHLCLCLGFLPLEKAMVTHSSTLAWRIPWMEESSRLQSMGSLRVRHDWATSLLLFTVIIGEGNSNPLQCSCLENPRDSGAWWAAIYGVTQSQTRLKWLSSSRLLPQFQLALCMVLLCQFLLIIIFLIYILINPLLSFYTVLFKIWLLDMPYNWSL